ncbi:hypothetical protein ABTY61_14760 [Kitasatospora sp. NPDC096128]|uniref:hypothetical protein n=1 Tax=Kitasatospora sp. NPDC096128 TaxID=3155547 RepID=UPI003333B71E
MRLHVLLAALALALGAAACGADPEEHRPAHGGAPAPTFTVPSLPKPPFPEAARQTVLRMARQDGTSPAHESQLTVAEFDSGYGPHLIWRAARTGDICMADGSPEGSAGKACVPPAKLGGGLRPGPSAEAVMWSAWFTDRTDLKRRPMWAMTLMAADEEIDHLSCQGHEFPVRRVFTTRQNGVPLTFYTASVPESLQGDYRVAVRRTDGPAEERMTITFGGPTTVQC